METHNTDSETSVDPTGPDAVPAEFSRFDPFPKPRLFPENWDLSELTVKTQPAKPMPEPSSWHEPFPKLRTFPGGWDLE